MFTSVHATALIIRVLISYIAGNVSALNEILGEEVGVGDTIILFQRGTLIVTMSRVGGKGVLLIKDVRAGIDHEFKLNSAKTPITKRVINDLEVWYHRQLREQEVEARTIGGNLIRKLNLQKELVKFGFMDRLFGKSKAVLLKTNNVAFDDLITVAAEVSVSLFGKVTATVAASTTLGTVDYPVRRILPVYFGTDKQFTATAAEPINDYVFSVIDDQLYSLLK